MESFTALHSWQRGMELVRETYAITRTFPLEEKYCLTQQLRRSAVSIVANIAEGFSRITPEDKKHKFIIARGECSEVQALLLCAEVAEYVSLHQIQRGIDLTIETGKLLSGMIHAQMKLLSH